MGKHNAYLKLQLQCVAVPVCVPVPKTVTTQQCAAVPVCTPVARTVTTPHCVIVPKCVAKPVCAQVKRIRVNVLLNKGSFVIMM